MSGRKFSWTKSDALDYESLWYLRRISVSFLAIFYMIDSIDYVINRGTSCAMNYGPKLIGALVLLNHSYI